MVDFVILLIWAAIITAISVISTIAVYKHLKKAQNTLAVKIVQAENELLDDLENIDPNELEQTLAGRQLLDMLRNTPKAQKRLAKVNSVRVALLDKHKAMIDGFRHRLMAEPGVEVVATAYFGEELPDLLTSSPIDVLLVEAATPVAPNNPNPLPLLYTIPHLLRSHPSLKIIVISTAHKGWLVKAIIDSGAKGYILKDDIDSLRELSSIVKTVSKGSTHLSEEARRAMDEVQVENDWYRLLTHRQLQALSLLAAYPDITNQGLAAKLEVSNSTVRDLLSDAFHQLNADNRSDAIAHAYELGLLLPYR